jgi:hypothetical protein
MKPTLELLVHDNRNYGFPRQLVPRPLVEELKLGIAVRISHIPDPHQGDPALPAPQNCTKTPIKADKVHNADDSKLIAIFPNWNKSSF